MKKLIKLKLNILLKYWNYLNFLRTNGILIFCQNLSLNAKKELNMLNYLKNFDYKWKILDKKDLKKFLDKNFFIKIKKFNNILIIKDIYNIKEIEKYLKNNNILVLGYYIQNIFFFKKDFNIKNLDKKNIVNKLKQQILNIYSYKIKIINKIKFIWIKLILLLKKKMATINQVSRKEYRKRQSNYSGTPLLKNRPYIKGICTVVRITSPKKPNSAERKIVRVKVKGGKTLTASIPGQGHNLQKFSVVLVRGGRANDVPACRYKVVRGKYDFSIEESFQRKKSRSKWGLKKDK